MYKKFKIIRKLPTWDKKLFSTFMKYSWYLLFSQVAFLILNQTDIIMITYFLGVSAVAYYSNAFVLVQTLIKLFTSISIILLPQLTQYYEEKKFKTLNNIMSLFYSLVLYLLFPFMLVFFLFPKRILTVFFGALYVDSSLVLSIFSISLVFFFLSQYNLIFLNGFGLAKNIVKIVWPVALLNFLLNIYFIQKYGIEGAASVTILGWAVITFFTTKLIIDKLDFTLDYLKIFKILISGLLFVTGVFYLKGVVYILNYYFSAFLILSIAFCIYLIIGYLFGIYKIKDMFIFLPNSKIKKIIIKYHNRFFKFLE